MVKSELTLAARFQNLDTRQGFVASVSVGQLPHYVEDWLADGKIRQHSPKTTELRRGLLNHLLKYLWANSCTECGAAEIRGFIASLENLRPTSVDTYFRNFKALFSWLKEEGIIEVSPMERIKKPVVRADQIQPLSNEQIQAVIDAADRSFFKWRNKALILFLLDTGVRASEVCAIRCKDIDFNGHSVTILGKGNKRRTVFFGTRTLRALYALLRGEDVRDDRFVFVAETGCHMSEPLTRSGVYQIVSQLIKAAGVKSAKCGPHLLRHSFAINYLRNGGDLFSLQQLLGHEKLEVTQKYCAIARADLENQHRKCSPIDNLARKKS